jgi:hypothetical protein
MAAAILVWGLQWLAGFVAPVDNGLDPQVLDPWVWGLSSLAAVWPLLSALGTLGWLIGRVVQGPRWQVLVLIVMLVMVREVLWSYWIWFDGWFPTLINVTGLVFSLGVPPDGVWVFPAGFWRLVEIGLAINIITTVAAAVVERRLILRSRR